MGQWWILAAMALPAFLLNIDFYGISVALPAIGEALGAGTTQLQWAVNGFTLALIAPLIAFGRLGDLVGRRRLLLVGVLLFALGSALCGFATDMGVLIAGRCVQGLAVALFSTSPLSIVGDVFPEEPLAADHPVRPCSSGARWIQRSSITIQSWPWPTNSSRPRR